MAIIQWSTSTRDRSVVPRLHRKVDESLLLLQICDLKANLKEVRKHNATLHTNLVQLEQHFEHTLSAIIAYCFPDLNDDQREILGKLFKDQGASQQLMSEAQARLWYLLEQLRQEEGNSDQK